MQGGRMLVLVDAENLAGGPRDMRGGERLRSVLEGIGSARCGTVMFVVGCSHFAARRLRGFTHDRHLWRSGPHGAERALLDAVEFEDVVTRFDWITIASGDGAFTPLAAEVARSKTCTVVSWKESLSAALGRAASEVVHLDDLLGEAAGETDDDRADDGSPDDGGAQVIDLRDNYALPALAA